MIKKIKKPIPFDFVLHEIESANPHTKPMFGAYGVYIGNKMVFILREREKSPEDNGVWLPVVEGFHEELQKIFPSMRSLAMFGPGPTGWQVLPVDAEDFEEAVLKACELVLQDDPRIGTTPKIRTKKKKKAIKAKPKPKTKPKAKSKVKTKPRRRSSKKS
ncbi:hypothetical protein [Bdellovibrio sp. HCB337]|uniref:hypothetical protein n=1 Tax=Bdellovibrio sp. HCB337 TaxID=3394358 RepID=UPI0039A408BB